MYPEYRAAVGVVIHSCDVDATPGMPVRTAADTICLTLDASDFVIVVTYGAPRSWW
jgi:hypothetical protein